MNQNKFPASVKSLDAVELKQVRCMKNINHSTIDQAKQFVKELLSENLPSDIGYHTFQHAQFVVDGVEEIGSASGLSASELNIAKLSGWFHDTGYIKSPEGHESVSAEIAGDFLAERDYDPAEIQLVKDAIMATKVPQKPKNIISEVLCDADMSHLAMPDYFEIVEHMRIEFWLTRNLKMSKKAFNENSIGFFGKHHYHTQYGKTVLRKRKEKNLARIKEALLTE